MSVNANQLQTIIQPSRQALAEVCQRFGVTWLAVFGSVARGEATPESDVDVLIEWDGSIPMTLLKIVELSDELSSLFDGRSVDIGRPAQLHWSIRERALADAKVLYAR